MSLDRLVEDGLLSTAQRGQPRGELAAGGLRRLPGRSGDRRRPTDFAAAAPWLDEFALYRALKRAHGDRQWTHWPTELRDREPRALAEAAAALSDEIAFARFVQWRFAGDWRALRAYAHARGVGLIGDIPIFVAHDSADVWHRRELFTLDDATGEPALVAGVPPDYFSATGQRWGNPLYRWDRMRADGYAWWIARFRTTLAAFDAVRLDHFIGFARYWEIPGDEPTAVGGVWRRGRARRCSPRSGRRWRGRRGPARAARSPPRPPTRSTFRSSPRIWAP